MHAKNRLILGEFPTMSIEQARTERSKFTDEIRGGIDPASTRPFQRTPRGTSSALRIASGSGLTSYRKEIPPSRDEGGALRAADNHDYGPLLAFVRSY
jgi:hypothetical protein